MLLYGYLKSKENHHILVPDSYAAPIVRKMFEMAANGTSVTEIAEWLNGNGILPPKRYYFSKGMVSEKESKGHIHWNKGVIYTVLKNRVYCGDMVQGKGKTKSYVVTKCQKSDWIVVADTHEAIVSRELFDAVQSRWSGGNPTNPKHKQSSTSSSGKKAGKCNVISENIFLRKVFCGHCGYSMRRHRSSKTKHRIKCETRSMYGKDDCILVSINEDVLKNVLLNELNKQSVAFGSVKSIGLRIPQEEKPEKAEIQKLHSEIDRNNRYLQSLYESLSQGDITSDEYRAMKADYESKIETLKSKEKELRTEMLNRAAKTAEDSKTFSHLQSVQQITDLTAETLTQLVKKIIVFENKRVEIHFIFTEEVIQVETEEAVTA